MGNYGNDIFGELDLVLKMNPWGSLYKVFASLV